MNSHEIYPITRSHYYILSYTIFFIVLHMRQKDCQYVGHILYSEVDTLNSILKAVLNIIYIF